MSELQPLDRRGVLFIAAVALGDLVQPQKTGMIAAILTLLATFYQPGKYTHLLVATLLVASDITNPAGSISSEVEVNFIYGNPYVGSTLGPALAALAALRIVATNPTIPKPYASHLGALGLLTALYALGAARVAEAPVSVALGPLLMIAFGMIIALNGKFLPTIITAITIKAAQTLFTSFAGLGFQFGGITRASFDSIGLVYPMCFVFLALSSRRWVQLLSTAVLGAITLTLTRQVWIWFFLAIIIVAVRIFSSQNSLAPEVTERHLRRRDALVAFGVSVIALTFIVPSETRFVYIDRLTTIPNVLVGREEASGDRNLRLDELTAIIDELGLSPQSLAFGRQAGSTFSLPPDAGRTLIESDYSEREIESGQIEKSHIPLLSHLFWGGLLGLALFAWATASIVPAYAKRARQLTQFQATLLAGIVPLLVGAWTPKLELTLGLLAGWSLGEKWTGSSGITNTQFELHAHTIEPSSRPS